MKFKKALLVGIAETAFDKPYWDKIDSLTEQRKHIEKNSPPQSLYKELADTDCLLVAFGNEITKKDIDAAPKLKYIGIAATAFNKVDVVYAAQKKIPVSNLAGYSTESVAEFVIAAIFEHIRCLEKGRQKARAGNYNDYSDLSATEIKGKVFGVLGLGNIGRRVAELAQGLGAEVRYWSRHRKKDAEKRDIKYEDADKIIASADFLSLNLAQSSDTVNFLNVKRIKKLKKGAVIINTAPMDLVDLDALAQRLKFGDITFILDHSDEMKYPELKKISKYENCIIYPPIAWISKEARIAKQEIFVGNMKNFLKGAPSNKVN